MPWLTTQPQRRRLHTNERVKIHNKIRFIALSSRGTCHCHGTQKPSTITEHPYNYQELYIGFRVPLTPFTLNKLTP